MRHLSRVLALSSVLVGAFSGTALATTTTQPTPGSEPPTSSTPLPDPSDPLFPLTEGSQSPAVAVVQQKLGVTVDCNFGGQTAQAVRNWQAERGDLEVTGQVGPNEWHLFDVAVTWGDDANDNGVIEPSEVNIDCADPYFRPEPVFHEDWPLTSTGLAAQICALSDEIADDSAAHYDPLDDTITISGTDGEDYGTVGDAVFDSMICVLGTVGVPSDVIARLSSTRALDGMQSASWEDTTLGNTVSALWTYHPDQGMNVTIWTM
jgi:hypothetical protein